MHSNYNITDNKLKQALRAQPKLERTNYPHYTGTAVSAISLILLAYTNRFLGYATLIRGLHEKLKANPNEILKGQIAEPSEKIVLNQKHADFRRNQLVPLRCNHVPDFCGSRLSLFGCSE